MGLANGVHHLALCTGDIKAQIEYFTEVLGAELVALYWMHGVPGAWHGFLKLADSSYVALVQTKAVSDIEARVGVSHAAGFGSPSAGGTMQHVAFNVDSEEELLTLRDRIRSHGLVVIGPIDHGFCKSIYFAGLEGLNLEIATSPAAIDERAWIDPEVMELAGISAEEVERYKYPKPYRRPDQPVAQPGIDPSVPQVEWGSPERYEQLVKMPDEVLTARLSETEPPVEVED